MNATGKWVAGLLAAALLGTVVGYVFGHRTSKNEMSSAADVAKGLGRPDVEKV